MSENDLLRLVDALVQGEVTAPDRLVRACLVPLYRMLRRRHLALPHEVVRDAAVDALLAIIVKPEAYDSKKGDLISYLVHIGDYKLRDWLRAHYRRGRREVSVGGMPELAWLESKQQIVRESGPDVAYADVDRLPPQLDSFIRAILPDPRDRELLELIYTDHKDIAEYAAILGINHLSHSQQRAEIKRHRDRIIKRLTRQRDRLRRIYHAGE